jgi:superfamily II DNA or RNA helicase
MTDGESPLRDYQRRAVAANLECFEGGVQAAICVMPTGTGKTEVAIGTAAEAKSRHGKRTLFLAQRELLVLQAARRFSGHGIKTHVEMGDRVASKRAASEGHPDVVCATVQTMHPKRLLDHWPMDYFGMIITDECHHAASPTHRSVYDWFKDSWHLGITATPDGGAIGKVYSTKSFEYSLREAVHEGWLTPIKIRRVPITVDLRGIRFTGGDFNVSDLVERLSPHIEELSDAICSCIGDRSTVVFTPDRGTAHAIAGCMSRMGIRSVGVAGSGGPFGQRNREREAAIKEFSSCECQAIVCSRLLTEGWDAPHASCVVNAAPTLQRHVFAQKVGRGTRPCQEIGKSDCLVVDLDWRTDDRTRDLCHVTDLYGDDGESGLTEEERSWVHRRQQEISDRGETFDPLAVVGEAKEYFRAHEKLMIYMTGRKAKYCGAVREIDPVGVSKLIGLKLNKSYDVNTWKAGEASTQQYNTLSGLGVEKPGTLSKWGASKMIRALAARKNLGLATPAQLDGLRQIGVADNIARAMRKEEAAAALDGPSPGV